MIDHEDKQSHSVVKTVLDAVADWVTRYRHSLKSSHQLDDIGPDQVAAIARDIGIKANQLRELSSKGDCAAASLRDLLIALEVDPTELDRTDPRIARDMQWLCIHCSNKIQCNFDLSIGIATTTFRNICPNAIAIDELFGLKREKATTVDSPQ